MNLRTSGHSVYKIQYHIVWTTKYRHRALNPVVFQKETDTIIRDIVSRIVEVELVELSVQPEHVHIVLSIPPRYAVAKVVEIIKSQSAKVVRHQITWLDNLYYDTAGLWSVGYFVSTIGIDENLVKKYVAYQQKKDSGQAKLVLP